ncbi:endo-alpha-N-acetylgalactosaminidase family protein [Janibacter sp. HTCC2649]|uniref:endo-alpha-N-acetylgalactosaminidase family protein n=1 Tax=Janibacter sp. HTCC2649 TaxID=313589 RepID=UPI0003228680|nr:endo-alpha-N-acetylgalactosaminidase family protein [Janibacter sp. HTCC2649]
MRRSQHTSRRLAAAASICAVAVGGLATTPARAASPPATAAMPSVDTAAAPVVIASADLEVQLSPTFPQALAYRSVGSGALLGGQVDPIASVTINGTPRAAVATVTPGASSAAYALTFADLPGVRIELTVSVEGNVLTWRVTKVTDSSSVKVGTLDIPGLDLVSVSSAQAGATTAFTKIDTNSTRNADVIAPVKATDAVQTAPVGAAYGIVNTAQLAASVETNGTYDKPTSATNSDNGRFWHQVRANSDGSKRVGIAPGQWTVRGDGAPAQSELPWAKVVVTGDANADAAVDWQDGAIAFRSIAQVAKGADQVPNRVVQHIPFNFSSLATHPFLRTLDDVKRISQETDGLGQFALLKGYASEGHDSAHPDYGDNFNTRAGGLDDMNTLLEQGKKWGADFGVHVNATEAYPEAKAFNETLVDKTKPGWNWLNQSYYINQRTDLNSGDLLRRTQQLRDATKGNLDTLYWDVYYTYGWLPDQMDAKLREQGWSVASEWAYSHERNSLWSHWATDRNYGGATNKGINSTIARFIRNGEKDVWNPDPVLGGSTIVEAEGWTGQHDWNALMKNVWANQVPTKFLQHFDITKWGDAAGTTSIDFDGGVRGTSKDGVRQLFVADAKVLDGDAYLLPWGDETPNHPTKAYHYNADGGTTTWKLAPKLRSTKSFTVYELSETGRTKVGTVANTKNSVTLTAKSNTAYVLYPNSVPAQADPQFGQGGIVKDPGFNASTLGAWSPQGTVTQEHLSTGQRVAQIGAGAGSISQQLTGLKAGSRYAASAWVQVAPGGVRPTTVSVKGSGVDVANAFDRSTVTNSEASNELHGTSYQRVRVIFTAPADGTVTFSVAAAAGSAPVGIDDVRVVATTEAAPAGDVIAHQDFEGVDQGWMPFVSGPAQSGGDARTHLSQRNAPYTQAGWNGKLVDDALDGTWSLKAHEEANGLVYRTWAGTVPFEQGHRYKVEFDYQNATAGAYSFVTGVDQVVGGTSKTAELSTTAFGQQRTTQAFSREITTGSCGTPFIGLRRNAVGSAQADFILDNLKVTDLGATDEPGACSRLEVTGPASGLVPGEANTFTTTFSSFETTAATDVTVSLKAPDGWTVTPTTTATFASVAPGASVKTTWRVVVPATTPAGSYALTSSAAYTVDGEARSVTASGSFATLPAGKIPQSRLSIAGVSDAEPASAGGQPSNAIDGLTTTMWHSAWSQVDPDAPFPHWITVDLGDTYDVNGYDYQVRIGNGSIKGYEIYVSADNVTWGAPVKTGSFASTTEVQHLDFTAKPGRYVKLVGLSSINGAVFGGAGEINVWGKRVNEPPVALSKAPMSIQSVDSQETEGEDGAATNVLDDNPGTFWHTEWLNAETPYPHHIAVDLGASHTLSGISVQGRQDGNVNGPIKDYEVYVSADGTNWGTPVAQGSFTATTAAQLVNFAQPTTGRFVKVVAKNSINGAAFAAIAELQFYAPATP